MAITIADKTPHIDAGPEKPASTVVPTIIEVPIDSVRPNAYNPNVMDDQKFNVLAEDVAAQGMDQPLVVRKVTDPEGTYHYEVVDGEHRLRASKVAGRTSVLVSVKEWDDTEARIHTLRRNVHGENNPAKFTKLVTDVNNAGMDLETIRTRAAIDQKSFQRLYRLDTPEKKSKALAMEAKVAGETNDAKTFSVANLSNMVRDIVSKHGGAPLNQGFVAFEFKGKTCLMVSMTSKMLTSVEQIRSLILADNLGEGALTKAIENALTDVLNKIEAGDAL